MSSKVTPPGLSSSVPQAPLDGEQTSSILLRKLATWAGFLAIIYVGRDFFFTAFMTFLFCYNTLTVVDWGMRRFSPDRERTWLRRTMTLGIFVLVPLVLVGIGIAVAPRVMAQGERLSGWLRQTSPETEVARLLEQYVGPSEFQKEYGSQDSPTYRKALEEFRQKGENHTEAYNEFPRLEAWVEGSIVKPLANEEQQRIRSSLIHEGTSSESFSQWFINDKCPQLKNDARQSVPEQGRPATGVSSLVRAAVTDSPQQLLAQARRDPSELISLRSEWIEDTIKKEFDESKASLAFLKQLRRAYETERQKSPAKLPFTFSEYTELRNTRPEGRRAFGEVIDRLQQSGNTQAEVDKQTQLRADFEAATKHDLFQQWWAGNSVAKFIRHQLQTGTDLDVGTAKIEQVLGSLLDLPVDLATSLMLSIFICIDFANLRTSLPRLRETWLRGIIDEVAPALVSLGQLIGRSMYAQGLIAMCNATLACIGLTLIGVEHEFLLALAVFILCLVPTLGAVMSLVLIVVFALFQHGGGPGLAMKAGAVVVFVMIIESFVLSPRILGKMMELHPVLLLVILPVAQYFFGIWGLILATPVSVYVVHVLILQRGLPGTNHDPAPLPKE